MVTKRSAQLAPKDLEWEQRYGAHRRDFASWSDSRLNNACNSDATVVALWLADSERDPLKEFYARVGAGWVAKFHEELMRRLKLELADE